MFLVSFEYNFCEVRLLIIAPLMKLFSYFRGHEGYAVRAQTQKHREATVSEPTEPPATPSTEVVPPAPTNSFQLEADLRKIGNGPEVIYKYLKVGVELKYDEKQYYTSKRIDISMSYVQIVKFKGGNK